MNFLSNLKRSFSLDERSLALFRVLLGLLVMSDVVYRIPDFANFYTDLGLVPRALFINEMAMPWSFSLHLANGSLPFVWVMFSLQFLLGLMLALGYKTPWAALGCYVMAVSVHNRNWLVNNGGDDILRAMLLFSIFLPLNRTFSVDKALRGEGTRDREIFSTWGLVFYLQAFVIYFISYVLKDHPIWREELTAVFYTSRLDIFTTPIGHWMKQFPDLQKMASGFTILLEWGGPLLLVLAFVFGRRWWIARMITVVLFLFLHLGIASTMYIGLFPYICCTLWLLFLPSEIWDLLLRPYQARGFQRLKLYYDGDCLFCKKMVFLIREFFLVREVEISRAQDTPVIHELLLKENSWVVVNEKNDKFFRWSAIVEVFRHAPVFRFLVPVFSSPILAELGERSYKWVASHRALMAQASQFLHVSDYKPVKTFGVFKELIGAFFFVTLLMWNLSTVKKWNIQAPFFQGVTRLFHFYQEWNMFAPFPKRDNIWIEIPALLTDGSRIELLSGDRDIHSIKKDLFPKLVKNEHWRKFFLNLQGRDDYARYYGGYLCREWNQRKIQKVPGPLLRQFEIAIYSQMNYPNGSKSATTKAMSWTHYCFDSDFAKIKKP